MMHEVSLIYEVLLHVEQASRQGGMNKVTIIKLTIGEQMMVMPEALQFAFDTLRKGPAAEAELKWEIIEGIYFYIDYIEGEESSD
ncbi:hydrogenase maturation nickel metallochaperone HypA [Thalassobacillus devorans]|uniref:hydrogenase maturation nickel metallochaperone HypA/HybF n=1 Tax=Thalassobacillus devorans TaxID=279813 RepID=UPI001F1D99D7|nr:hydrogenase maturation nickel metallochaperone HypA [Thalassobacillus devorans]